VWLLAVPAAAGRLHRVSDKDEALLRAGVIQASDVPSGWMPDRPRGPDPNQYGGHPACKALNNAVDRPRRKVPNASSSFFDPNSGDPTTTASDTVYAFTSVSAATKYLAAFQKKSAPACLYQSTHVAATPIPGLQGVGDDNAGYERTLPIPGLTAVSDILDVRVGRAVVEFTFQNVGAGIPPGPDIVNVVIGRVKRVQS